jgi:hypothetical protein
LEKLPAVQSAPQNEMPVEQRARVTKNLQNFRFSHPPQSKVSTAKRKASSAIGLSL